MPLPNEFSLSSLTLAYVFTFDLPTEELRGLRLETVLLKDLIAGQYVVKSDSLTIWDEASTSLLRIYNRDMYHTRFKRSMLQRRQAALVEFSELSVVGLSEGSRNLFMEDERVPVRVTCTLNEMGAGSLVLWIEPNEHRLFYLESLQRLRDPTRLLTTLQWKLGQGRNSFHLTGRYSLLEAARFLVIVLFSSFLPPRQRKKILSQVNDAGDLETIHLELCSSVKSGLEPSNEMDSYPIFFSNLESTDASSRNIHEWLLRHAREVRCIVTGDKNWQHKKESIANDFLNKVAVSTRDSIWWYTHANGSLKIYSKEMGTSLLTSKVLLAFEIEFVLVMKHFAYRIVRNLNSLTETGKVRAIPLKELARLRDEELRRLDEYYNLDVLQKDTTAARLRKFHESFNVKSVLSIALKKIESLNIYLDTEYQSASMRRTLALSIIFGAFGAGKLIFDALSRAIDEQVIQFPFLLHGATTTAGMIVVGLLIWLIFRHPRIR